VCLVEKCFLLHPQNRFQNLCKKDLYWYNKKWYLLLDCSTDKGNLYKGACKSLLNQITIFRYVVRLVIQKAKTHSKIVVNISFERYVCFRVWILSSVIKQSTYYKHSTWGKCCMHVHFCLHRNTPFKERQLLSKLLILRWLSLVTKKCIIYFTNNINYPQECSLQHNFTGYQRHKYLHSAKTTGSWITLRSQAQSSICKFLYLTYK